MKERFHSLFVPRIQKFGQIVAGREKRRYLMWVLNP
jgi:hypothetical protein